MADESVLTCLTDDGELFVVVTADQRIRCFETATGRPHGDQFRLPSDHIPHCLTTRSRLLAIGMTSGYVVIVDLTQGSILHQISAHADHIHDLCFTSDTKKLYICSNDGHCSEWAVSPEEFVKRRQFRPSKRSITRSLAISPDNTQLACGASTIRLLDLTSLKSVAKLRGHASDVIMMRFSTTADMLYSIAHSDRTINAFRLKKGSKETVDAHVCYLGVDLPRSFTIGANTIACVLQTGNVTIFNIAQAKRSSKQKSVTEFVSVNCGGAALALRLMPDDAVMIAGGHITQPVFKSCQVDQSVDLSPFEAENAPKCDLKRRAKTQAPVEVVSTTVKKQKVDHAISNVSVEETLPLPLNDDQPAASADSMITLLAQGLKSNDNSKLCLVLDQDRDSFISSTLSRLPPALIPSLISVMIQRIRFAKKPKHLANAMNWLQCLLQRHTAYLLGNSAVADQLAEAKLLLENRQRCASSLMALSGRLTMLQYQLQRNPAVSETISQPTVFVHDVNEQ